MNYYIVFRARDGSTEIHYDGDVYAGMATHPSRDVYNLWWLAPAPLRGGRHIRCMDGLEFA